MTNLRTSFALAGVALAAVLAGCQTAPKLTPRPVSLDVSRDCRPLRYPDVALRRELQGRVMLTAKVALDGRVSDVQVTQSMVSADLPAADAQAAQALDDAAVAFLKQCRFAAVSGPYAPTRVRVPVRFALQ